jgi:NADH-quinone oxidoreductase subunit A
MGVFFVLIKYLPIFLFLFVGFIVGCVPLLLNILLAPRKYDEEKISPYECGFEPFEDARIQFDVRFYLVAILFIIFDLEIAFLLPWSIVFNNLGFDVFIGMFLFLLILIVGFIYEWKKGALDWE